MKPLLTIVLFALVPFTGSAQSVKLPADVRGGVAAFIEVPAETKDGYVSWLALDNGLNVFPTRLLKDTKTAVVTASAPGRYRLACVTASGDKPSEFAQTVVIVGDAPPVPPGPGPTPPGPTPPNPGDLGPFGGAAGLRVLIVYESGQPLMRDQFSAIYGKEFRDYIEQKCVKVNGTPERRIYDQNQDVKNESKTWQDAMARKRASVPWIAVGNGNVWHEGPLPITYASIIELVKKVGG